ncbi:MAG: response regulator transcription factor [Candidatus Korobacteraceae bacterium]
MGPAMESVLVVEDSRAMQQALRRIFASDSLEVAIAPDGIVAMEMFRAQTPSAVVLDLRLPGKSGKQLCREFKALAPRVPIVVVSANADIDDKVLLLELGADDYVTKPFSPKELLARVRRAMRRVDSAAQAVEAPPERARHDILTFSDVYVDFSAMEATKAGKAVTLTAQEFRVLKFLSSSPGRVVSREELLNEVWGYHHYPSTRTVDNHILRLRQKLETDPASPRFLVTVHGAGYKFMFSALGSPEGSAGA